MKIGIIGAGQLGRMLALAGYPLGLKFRFLDRSADAPGGQIGDIITGNFADRERLAELADSVDILTFDVENVPADVLNDISRTTPFWPPVRALATAQDRLSEKTLFTELGIATPGYRTVDSHEDLVAAVADLGLPAVLKTRRLGYDGRGQRTLRAASDLEPAWQALGSVPLILEEFIQFDREVSAIGVRSTHGETTHYPLAHNVHENGILRYAKAPAADDDLERRASVVMKRLLEHFDYAGVLTLEFFVRDGELIANEIAPRVHNSGHWTIEGAVTSQFENHIRAILGLPLGDTTARGHTAMVNFLGTLPSLGDVLAVRGAHYHAYGKSPRPDRKLGHCTLIAATPAERDTALARLLQLATPKSDQA